MKNPCSVDTQVLRVSRQGQLPIAYSLSMVAVLLASGCATSNHGGTRGSSHSTSGSTHSTTGSYQNSPLIEVYVPGSVRNAVYDSPNKQLNPLLNPRTPPPRFVEESNLAKGCSPTTKQGVVDDRGASLVDEVRFQQLMARGTEIAQARHVWKFNVERNEAQKKVVSGPRSTRQRGDPVEPRPSSDPSRGTRSSRTAPLIPNLTRSQPSRGGSRSGMHSADEINSKLPNFNKMQEDLAYNAQILDAQDSALSIREREYSEQLLVLYQGAFSKFNATPLAQISLTTLNRFDMFRFKNIYACTVRGESTETTKQLNQEVNGRYDPMARQIIETNRDQIVRAIKAAKSSAELQTVYEEKLSTEFLRNIASRDQILARALQERSVFLLAQEVRAREEARKRAEAEAERQAMLLKKKHLQNAANNVAPTPDDVLRLVSTYVMENTVTHGSYGRLERTGIDTFNYFSKVSIFGELLLGEFQSGIGGLSCKPERNRQRCSLTESRTYTEYNLGLFRSTYAGDLSGRTHEAEFYWDGSGLQSPGLKMALSGAGYYGSQSGSGNSRKSSSSGRSDEDHELRDSIRDRRDEQMERERERQEAQRWQDNQDRMRQQNPRNCSFGSSTASICN